MTMSVAIFGGGVGGLSAAHELIDRGFAVSIHEQGDTLGGKARSFGKPGSGSGGRKDLPGEHGFRFFPGFYRHIIDSMTAIPVGSGSAADKLDDTEMVGIARQGQAIFQLPVLQPQSPLEWLVALKAWFGNPELGVPNGEVIFFAEKLFEFITSCNDRRFDDHESTSWWKFLDADNQSPAYQNLLARGMTRSLVAMQAEVASTRTIATILWQMLLCIANPMGMAADRVLTAPTNDAWLDPWIQYLKDRGVVMTTQSRADAINLAGNAVQSVGVTTSGIAGQVLADFYVFAVPKEAMETLATAAVKAAAPSLGGLPNLKVDWMNGIQYYLNRDLSGANLPKGHIILSDAPWALTVLEQRQFWPGVSFPGLGDGTVKALLSVDISDWVRPGAFVQKPAKQCTEAEIVHEVWEQLKSHLQPAALQNGDVVTHFLDPAIVIGSPTQNLSPLLINTINSWADRPNAVTEIPNLFLASDYVRTCTDLACMEGANEAARLAVNGILEAAGAVSTPQCALWPLKEPSVFDAAKEIDQFFYDRGWPHPGVGLLSQLLGI